MPEARLIQAKIFAAQRRFPSAVFAIEHSIELSEGLRAKPEIRNAYELLANVYRLSGDGTRRSVLTNVFMRSTKNCSGMREAGGSKTSN